MIMLRNNGRMQDIWISRGVRNFQAAVWGGTEAVRDYFSLRKENDSLAEKNHRLENLVREYRQLTGIDIPADSADYISGRFRFTHARAVKVSRNKQHNYLILDKGTDDGIEELSGVITDSGVIGIIDAVGERYSYARSFQNSGMTVSARIGSDGPVGEMIWDGVSSNGAVLMAIPLHIPVQPGDTVYTSGFSSIFPADIPLGITGEATVINGSTYNIQVTLFADFNSIKYVTIAENNDDEAIKELENRDED